MDSLDIYLPLVKDIINDSLKRGIFPKGLRLSKVIPLFKKADLLDETNCRTVSLLSHISKVFERVVYNQINESIKPLLPQQLIAYRQNHNAQHFLLKKLETFKEALDKSNSVSTIFIDLSKTFDTLNLDLLVN